MSARNTAADVLAKVEQRGEGECWPWTGYITPRGYGAIAFAGRRGVLAHRLVYEILVGPAPAFLDHTCHNGTGCRADRRCPHRRCCNPAHLEPVTRVENTRRGEGISVQNSRKTHCAQGHEFTPENTFIYTKGRRGCRTCRARWQREYELRRRSA